MSEWRDLSTRPFTYARSDFRALAELGRPRIVGWLFLVAWALLALAAFLIAICWLAGASGMWPYAAAITALLAAFLLLHRFGADLGAWSLETAARRSGLLRDQVVTVAQDAFRSESTRGRTDVRWSAVPRIHVGQDRLFVFSTHRMAFIVPRRALGDDFEAFVAAVDERWRSTPREPDPT